MQALSSDGAVAESSVSAFTQKHAAFDLKGVLSSLTVMRLRSRDLNLIDRQLRAKVMQHPQFFLDAPVVLDVGSIDGGLDGYPLAALVRALRVCKVVPIAITNVPEGKRELALSAGLGIISLGAARPGPEPEAATTEVAPAPKPVRRATPASDKIPVPPSRPTPPPAPAARPVAAAAPAPAPRPAPAAHRPPVVVRQAVRSGQVVYAEKTDLIVLAPVNPGAQLVADGNIHVYAVLRGRALAGAKGFNEARIFCQKLEAELCAINGAYVTFDDIPRDRLGKPAQIAVHDGRCVIGTL
jgi:septum site-determining protein MinC